MEAINRHPESVVLVEVTSLWIVLDHMMVFFVVPGRYWSELRKDRWSTVHIE